MKTRILPAIVLALALTGCHEEWIRDYKLTAANNRGFANHWERRNNFLELPATIDFIDEFKTKQGELAIKGRFYKEGDGGRPTAFTAITDNPGDDIEEYQIVVEEDSEPVMMELQRLESREPSTVAVRWKGDEFWVYYVLKQGG